MRPVLPHEDAWQELGLLDPQGTGTAWCEPRRQQPVRLTPHLLRVTADNGQNTYVVGGDECAVVGPCSDDATHLDTLLAAAPGPVRWVVQLTGGPEEAHAVAQLHERTNAQVIDARVTPAPLHGAGFTLEFVSQGSVRVAPDSILICTEPPAHGDESIAWIAPRRGFLRAGQRQGETT